MFLILQKFVLKRSVLLNYTVAMLNWFSIHHIYGQICSGAICGIGYGMELDGSTISTIWNIPESRYIFLPSSVPLVVFIRGRGSMPPINSFDCPVSAVEKGADMKSRQPHSLVVGVPKHFIKPTLLWNNNNNKSRRPKCDEKRPIMPKKDTTNDQKRAIGKQILWRIGSHGSCAYCRNGIYGRSEDRRIFIRGL